VWLRSRPVAAEQVLSAGLDLQPDNAQGQIISVMSYTTKKFTEARVILRKPAKAIPACPNPSIIWD